MRCFWIDHSPIGASSAKRWMACPGSVRLIASMGEGEDDTQEFAAEGLAAHEVVAESINRGAELWTFVGREFTFGQHTVVVDPEMIAHCQLYLDTLAKSLPAGQDVRLLVEQRVSYAALGRPEMYGTLDLGFVEPGEDGDTLHILDLKYGAGIFVHQADPQFRYYAGAVIGTFPELCANVTRVKIWVVQPRIDWQGPKARTATFTKGELDEWVCDELMPAVDRTRDPDAPLVPGKEQCQFCPAMATCPAQRERFDQAMALVEQEPSVETMAAGLSDEELGDKLDKADTVKKFIRALEREAYARLDRNKKVPGWRLGEGKSSRVGKPGYEAAAVQQWGNRAYKPVEVMTIPALEKLPGGKKFVQEWGHKPQGAPVLVAEKSDRPAVAGRGGPKNAFRAILDKHHGVE